MAEPRVVLRLIVELRDPAPSRSTEKPFARMEQREGVTLNTTGDGERLDVQLANIASELGIGAASFVADNLDRLDGRR